MNYKHLCTIPLLCAPLLGAAVFAAPESRAATQAFISGGTIGEDYNQSVFRRIGDVWEPPRGIHGDYLVEVELSIDGSGALTECRVTRSSGVEMLDVSTCGAAHKVGDFGPPPGGQPTRIVCSLQMRKSGDIYDDPDEALKREVRERTQRQLENRTLEAGYAEEDARARAEAAARGETVAPGGKKEFGGYEFLPGQQIPGAREVLDRTPRVPVGGDAKTAAQDGKAPAEKVAPGPVISRYPPVPDKAPDLVVDMEDSGSAAVKGDGGKKAVAKDDADEARSVEAARKEAAAREEERRKSLAERREAEARSHDIAVQVKEATQRARADDASGGAAQSAPVPVKPETKGDRADAHKAAPVKEAAESAGGSAAAQAPSAGGGYVIPQPPAPPAGVKGMRIDPSKAPATAEETERFARAQERARAQAQAGGATNAGSRPQPAAPAKAAAPAEVQSAEKAKPAAPARVQPAEKAKPAAPARVQPAEKAKPAAPARVQPAEKAKPAAPAGVQPAEKAKPAAPAGVQSAEEPKGEEDGYVLPQPPAPPAGVKGMRIDPSKAPATAEDTERFARAQERARGQGGGAAGVDSRPQPAAPVKAAAPAKPQPAEKARPATPTRTQPAEKARPVTPTRTQPAEKARPATPARTQPAEKASPATPARTQPAAEPKGEGGEGYVLPQPPTPDSGVKGVRIDPKAPPRPLPISKERAAELQREAAEAAAAKAAAVSPAPAQDGRETPVSTGSRDAVKAGGGASAPAAAQAPAQPTSPAPTAPVPAPSAAKEEPAAGAPATTASPASPSTTSASSVPSAPAQPAPQGSAGGRTAPAQDWSGGVRGKIGAN